MERNQKVHEHSPSLPLAISDVDVNIDLCVGRHHLISLEREFCLSFKPVPIAQGLNGGKDPPLRHP